ncbi:hypothetical protein BJY52DRAFT_1226410 [Lactarius psammicola]|nr:hypothetical protein BJY52DRAFT_1226410 [Lactarius psammicola]
MPSSFELFGPEHWIEHNHFALYVSSQKRELKPREEPWVANDSRGGTNVFINFEAVPGENFRLFVRHDNPVDASADISFEGKSLGKWCIARESNVWHNTANNSLLKFQDSYGHRSKVFEPSTFEIRFQYLSRIDERRGRGVLAPVIVRESSPEDGPGWVQSVFAFL